MNLRKIALTKKVNKRIQSCDEYRCRRS